MLILLFQRCVCVSQLTGWANSSLDQMWIFLCWHVRTSSVISLWKLGTDNTLINKLLLCRCYSSVCRCILTCVKYAVNIHKYICLWPCRYTRHCQLCFCSGDKELLANGAYDLFAAKVRWNSECILTVTSVFLIGESCCWPVNWRCSFLDRRFFRVWWISVFTCIHSRWVDGCWMLSPG